MIDEHILRMPKLESRRWVGKAIIGGDEALFDIKWLMEKEPMENQNKTNIYSSSKRQILEFGVLFYAQHYASKTLFGLKATHVVMYACISRLLPKI